MQRLFDLIEELKRRKVFQVASIYLVTAWGASLGVSELLPAFGAPNWVVRAVVIGLLLLFPVVVALAWFYELTREGVVRDPADVSAESDARRSLTTLQTSLPTPAGGLEVSWQDQGRRRTLSFTSTFIAGRDASCEVSTLDPVASRNHVRFEYSSIGWMLVDLDSSNGTLLNGVLVRREPVASKCVVQLGKGGQELELRILDRTAETMIMSRAD